MKENRHGVEKRRHDDKKKADLLSEQFMSVYVKEDVENIPRLGCFIKGRLTLQFITLARLALLCSYPSAATSRVPGT